MWSLIFVCLLATAMGHPMKVANEKVINKRSIGANGDVLARENHVNVEESIVQKTGNDEHRIAKRSLEMDDTVQDDCSQLSGDAYQACDEQRVRRDISQGAGGQSVDGTANQDGGVQEAWSNEGAYARQGDGGQFISASDYGGPIVQILQHVYKANCCECGCNCGCPEEEETTTDASG